MASSSLAFRVKCQLLSVLVPWVSGLGPASGNTEGLPSCTWADCSQCLAEARLLDLNLSLPGPDGKTYMTPMRIARPKEYWDSNSMLGTVLGILVREKLGLAVDYVNCVDGYACELAMNNCGGWKTYECEQPESQDQADFMVNNGRKVFADPLPDVYATLEIWPEVLNPASLGFVEDTWAIRETMETGALGMTVQNGLWLLPKPLQSAWTESQLVLSNFLPFTTPLPLDYLATPRAFADAEVPPEVAGCPGDFGLPVAVEAGFRILEADGYVCRDSWWLTPACASLGDSWWDDCVAVLDDDWGFPKPKMYTALSKMGARVAKIVLGYDGMNEVLHSGKFNATFLWWNTDTQFLSLQPVRVTLPPSLEAPHSIPSKSMWAPAVQSMKPLHTLISQYALNNVGLNAMLKLVSDAQSEGQGPTEIAQPGFFQKCACDWIRANEATWSEWLPNSRSCQLGAVFDAVDQLCKPCPVGSAHRRSSAGGECHFCQPGRMQDKIGTMQCNACPVGMFSGTTGSSECTTCEIGTFSNRTAMSECTMCLSGQETLESIFYADSWQWMPVKGASSNDVCGCKSGTREVDGECVACREGQLCKGMNTFFLWPGYHSLISNPTSVFRCHGEPLRCPGGDPGACAVGRSGTSTACGRCKEDHTSGSDGTCTQCGGKDLAPFAALCVLMMAVLAAIYYVLDTRSPASEKDSTVLLVSVGSQLLTLSQQLGVIRGLSLEWPSPFSDILNVVDILNFDLDVISIDCVFPYNPVSAYAGKVFSVCVLIGAMVVIHSVFVLVKHRSKILSRTPSLVAAIGSVINAFFIAIVANVLGPFQCLNNPNGLQTLRADQSVVCWESGYEDHASMIVTAAIAILLPAAFLAGCIIVVIQLPRRMQQGHAGFLHASAFLVLRFRAGAHWWALIFLVRNTLVSIAPVFPDAFTQIFFLMCIFLPYHTVAIYIHPLRLWSGNILEAFINLAMISILVMSAFFVENAQITLVAQFCCGFFVLMLVLLVLAATFALCERLVPRRQAFQYFLCHHKGSAGSFSRFFKMVLIEQTSVTRKVFLDCDDLRDLNMLFSSISSHTETLVILGTQEILTRPWCLGEMTTARLNTITTALVIFPNFVWPDEAFVRDYSVIVPLVNAMAPYGISIGMVQDTLPWLRTLPHISIPLDVSKPLMDILCQKLIARKYATDEDVAIVADNSKVQAESPMMILVDHSHMEATATACILEHMLRPAMYFQGKPVPQILCNNKTLPDVTQKIVVVCSNGVFKQPHVISALFVGADLGARVLPIICDEGWLFPSVSFYEGLEDEGPALLAKSGIKESVAEFMNIIESIFKEIAISFQPGGAEGATEILKVKANAISVRLLGGLQRLTKDADDGISTRLSATLSVRSKNSVNSPVLADKRSL